MKNSRSSDKTINLNATKGQSSPRSNQKEYFNPYGASTYTHNKTPRLEKINKRSTAPALKIETKQRDPKRKIVYEETSSKMRTNEIRQKNKLSPKQILRNKKRRQRRFVAKILGLMVIVIGFIWGIIAIKEVLTYPNISYLKVQKGTLDNSEVLEGIIVRDEVVYHSKGEGAIQYITAEGERVSKNGQVCALINGEVMALAENEKDNVSHILYNEANQRKELSYYQDENYQIDLEVKNTLTDFYSNRFKESTDYIYAMRKQLDGQVEKRTSLYIKDQKQADSGTAKELTTINNKINSIQHINYTDQSGIVSYMIDGKEDKLSSESLDTIDYKTFSTIRQNSKFDILRNTYIEKDMPLYKLILDDKWYIVSYIDLEKGEAFKEGQRYDLSFDGFDNLEINFMLQMKVEEENRLKLVFETKEQGNKFLGLRNIQMSIGDKKVEGLKIPLQAIVEQHMIKIPATYEVEKEGEVGVYKKNGEITEFIKITTQYEKDEELYVLQELGNTQAIQLNDILIQPDTGLTEKIEGSQAVKGVYVINGRMAQFKAIDIYLQNSEHALIKQDANSQLKELDKIISNPKSIKTDQLLDHINIQNQ